MSSVELRGVAKKFRKVPALAGIDLSVQDGEFCVLVGLPAAGKTTLLRTVAGLEKADAGEVTIDGAIVNDWTPGERNVAVVFQYDTLFPKMSAYQNIAFGLRAQKMRKADIAMHVRRFADFVGIADLLDISAERLRDGPRQLVAIGRALVREPAVRLFDDPLAHLDAPLREALCGVIKQLHDAFPATTLHATRDPLEAMTLGDRVVLMRAGSIEQEGAPLEIFERPATRFVAGFFGSPPMNFLPGRLARTGAGDAVLIGEERLNVPLPPGRMPRTVTDGTEVVLGIRPEHMVRALRASPADGSLRLNAEIELLRPAGSRAYATFKVAGFPVVAELQAHDASGPGDRFAIDVNLKRVSIFDEMTENAL